MVYKKKKHVFFVDLLESSRNTDINSSIERYPSAFQDQVPEGHSPALDKYALYSE